MGCRTSQPDDGHNIGQFNVQSNRLDRLNAHRDRLNAHRDRLRRLQAAERGKDFSCRSPCRPMSLNWSPTGDREALHVFADHWAAAVDPHHPTRAIDDGRYFYLRAAIPR